MGCVDCGRGNNWDNCDALEIEKGTNRLPKKTHNSIASRGRSDRERTIWFADAHRGEGKRFLVRADERLSAFRELESAIRSV